MITSPRYGFPAPSTDFIRKNGFEAAGLAGRVGRRSGGDIKFSKKKKRSSKIMIFKKVTRFTIIK